MNAKRVVQSIQNRPCKRTGLEGLTTTYCVLEWFAVECRKTKPK